MPDNTEIAEDLAGALERAHKAVCDWPERRGEPMTVGGDGFMDLLALRNLVPEAAAQIRATANLAGEIEALRADNLAWQETGKGAVIQMAEERAARLAAERERDAAVALLKPFAEAADDLDDKHGDGSPIWEAPAAMSIDAGHLREAARFLATLTEGNSHAG